MNFVICIESSHLKGMGHLYRSLILFDELSKHYNVIFLINRNIVTQNILEDKSVKYLMVDLDDIESNWEQEIIKKYKINFWINDRLNLSLIHI